jgi:hypothetical protein
MSKKNHWRFFILRWHKRIGVFLAIFAIWIAASGFFLNHTEDFDFLDHSVKNTSIRNWYGLTQYTERLPLQNSSGHWQAGELNFSEKTSIPCTQLLHFYSASVGNMAICSSDIYLLTTEGDIIDKIHHEKPFTAYTEISGNMHLKQGDSIFFVDINNWSLSQVNNFTSNSAWSAPLSDHYTELKLSRVLQDLHSGRFFGKAGVYFVDGLAFLLIILALSGLVSFLKKKK